MGDTRIGIKGDKWITELSVLHETTSVSGQIEFRLVDGKVLVSFLFLWFVLSFDVFKNVLNMLKLLLAFNVDVHGALSFWEVKI